MEVNGSWLSPYGSSWKWTMKLVELCMKLVGVNGSQWKSMEVNGSMCGSSWKSVEVG